MQTSHHAKIRLTSPHVFERIAEMIRASSIMTPRDEFEYCKPDDLLTERLSVMEEQRFDALPMLDGNDLASGRIRYYVYQDGMNKKVDKGCMYCKEAATEIDNGDLLGVDKHMEDVIRKFSGRTNKTKIPLFLVDSTDRIVGLITLADLDKTAAKMHLFALISELELSLLEIVSEDYKRLREICLCPYCETKRTQRKLPSGSTLEEYHYLFLKELLHIVLRSANLGLIDERIGNALTSNECEDIAELRNAIAHPKPLVSDDFLIDRLFRVHNLLRHLISICKR